MTRFLELLTSLLIVVVLFVLVGLFLPDHRSLQHNMETSHPMRQVYDVLDNLRRVPEYVTLRTDDPRIKFELGGKPFGPGAEISWTSSVPSVGDGSLTIVSAQPAFDEVDDSVTNAKIVWKLSLEICYLVL